MIFSESIQIKTINHLGLIAGIIDDIGIEKIINEIVGLDMLMGLCLLVYSLGQRDAN